MSVFKAGIIRITPESTLGGGAKLSGGTSIRGSTYVACIMTPNRPKPIRLVPSSNPLDHLFLKHHVNILDLITEV